MDVSSKVLGIRALAKMLAETFHKSAKQSLPLAVREMTSRITANQTALNAFGPVLPSDSEGRISMMYKLATELADNFRKHMKGSVSSKDTNALATQTTYSGGNIFKVLFRELFDDELRSVESTFSTFTDQFIDRAIKMHQGDSIPGFPSIYAFMYLVSPLLEDLF